MPNSNEYRYEDAEPAQANAYLWPAVRRIVENHRIAERRAFDLGCGNGATAHMLHGLGFEVTGVDPSASGIAQARAAFPDCRFAGGSAYNDLAGEYGRFPLVISIEVIEHCYDPRKFAEVLYDLVAPGGLAIVSTPYHSYIKNMALAVAGKFDTHFTALWDGGHIKFFSVRTLGVLIREAGFRDVRFTRVGRVPPLAKSMIAVARKPLSALPS